MKKSDISHVYFDLDHTLWDFDRNSALAFERIFEAHRIELELSSFIEVYEPINFNYWKLYREERISKLELRRGRFHDAFSNFGLRFSEDKLDALATSYIMELPKDNHLFDGTLEVLEYLNSRYRLHIITNGFEEVQHLKIQKSGIEHFFDTVTTSEEAGVKKPNPVIFETALSKADANPGHSVMIGDTFEADILGAERVGMYTLFYNYRREIVPINYRSVDRLEEIKYFL